CGDELVQLAALRERLGKVAAETLGDVEQRAERPWGEERIARAPEDQRFVGLLGAALAEEPRLPDAGLTAHQNEHPAGAGLHVCEGMREHGQLALPFEQSLLRAQGDGQIALLPSRPRLTSCTAGTGRRKEGG